MNNAISQSIQAKATGKCFSPKQYEKSRITPRKESITIEGSQISTNSNGRSNEQEKAQTPNISKSQEKNGENTPNEIENKTKGKRQVGESNENGRKRGNAHHQKTHRQCSNQYCWKLKEYANQNSPTYSDKKRAKDDHLNLVKLENSNEKVLLCRVCMKRYINKEFCQFCNQVYFDHINIDNKGWIQCDKCDLWNHLQCESEKIQIMFSDESKLAYVKYQCPRCIKYSNLSPKMEEDDNNNTKKPGRKNKKQAKINEKMEKKQETTSETLNIPFTSPPQKIPQLLKGSRRNESLEITPKVVSENQFEHEFQYTIEHFKKNKNIHYEYRPPQIQYSYNYPRHIPGYSTLEELLKSAGGSIVLDESNIKNDLQAMKNCIQKGDDSVGKNVSLNQKTSKNQQQTIQLNYQIDSNQNTRVQE